MCGNGGEASASIATKILHIVGIVQHPDEANNIQLLNPIPTIPTASAIQQSGSVAPHAPSNGRAFAVKHLDGRAAFPVVRITAGSEKLCRNSSLKDLLNCSVLPDTICAAAAALPGPNGRIEGGPTPSKLPGGFGVFPFKSVPPLICKRMTLLTGKNTAKDQRDACRWCQPSFPSNRR